MDIIDLPILMPQLNLLIVQKLATFLMHILNCYVCVVTIQIHCFFIDWQLSMFCLREYSLGFGKNEYIMGRCGKVLGLGFLLLPFSSLGWAHGLAFL